jgi:transposase-like protein
MVARRRYSDAFKANIVRRICAPNGPTAYEVSRETGISSSTVYFWVKQAEERTGMTPPEKPKKPRRPQDWTPAEKLKAVMDTLPLSDEELGRYLRQHGLHEEQLVAWRVQCESVLGPVPRATTTKTERRLKKENQRLAKELKRKDAALAETAALLVLSKKFNALWEDEGENT